MLLVNARQVLGLVGGVFLLWLAWQTIRSTPTEAATVTTRRRGYAGAYLSILGLTLTNPMTILSFAALFAGLGVTSGATGDAALTVLGVLLGSTTWWIVLTTVVGTLRTRMTPRWIHRINVGSGVIIGRSRSRRSPRACRGPTRSGPPRGAAPVSDQTPTGSMCST